MKKDKEQLLGVIEGYREIADVLEKVILGHLTPKEAVESNPFISVDIKVALKEAGYIK